MTEHPTPELHADARAHFMATMRFEHEQGDEEALGRATVGPYLETGPGLPSRRGLLRVDIRDPGRDGRVAAVVVAGTRPMTA
jgi:hypothetical protein